MIITDRYVLIMAGGIGTRFWPMSRSRKPKQFLDFLGLGKTLIQLTYERVLPLCPPQNIYIITNHLYEAWVREQLPMIRESQIVSEPVSRNTAACIAYGSFKLLKENPRASVLVTPCDHLILHEVQFLQTIEKAYEIVEKKNILMTLGIKPTRPETGYGYIQYVLSDDEQFYHKAKTFVEKPTAEIAKTFLASGEFVWNSGIFVWQAREIVKAFEQHLNEIYVLFNNLLPKLNTAEEVIAVKNVYERCKNISIDYGILEKAKNVYVIPSKFGWSDLGTWRSVYDHSEKDYHGNSVSGQAIVYDSSGCMVNIPREKLVILEGLKDYIVVDHDNVLLICRMESEQTIRQFLADVKERTGTKYM